MPWVRLHGIHSYYDMVRLYEKFPQAKGTINFVPSLIEQLYSYVEEGKSDTFLDHTQIPAEELNNQQKMFLLRYFFMANPDRKIAPYPTYQRLFTRRGLDHFRIDFQQAIRFFSTQDYLDLQVLYNLVWFGFAAREEIPEIGQLLSRGEHFTEEDKAFVVNCQRRILKNLLDALRSTASRANVEISTTPYYHPIFPLLIDTNFALRCMPKATLPPQLKLPMVAAAQLKCAIDSMEKWTGIRPQGIWPAEGSVCPEMIPILADAGIRWMATDDRVLKKSLPRSQKDIDTFQPFFATFEGKSIGMIFRDYGLSDLIGFTYHKMSPQQAVADFIGHIKRIDEEAKGARLVTVILDGENPWESYPESGREFLNTLFAAFEKEGVPTTTVSGYLEGHQPQVTIDRLHTGSWIDTNFNIWIGKPQKNQAWSYIKQAWEELSDVFSTSRREEDPKAGLAFESFSAACSSDWFWWFDDDFDSAFKPDFDRIFRQHLKNSFSLIDKDIPLYLFEPIYRFTEAKRGPVEPSGFMYPTIDGERTSFFEWANALRMNVRGKGSAMALGAEPFESISFGFNAQGFFLRIDPVEAETGFTLGEDDELVIHLHDGGKHYKFRLKKKLDGFTVETLPVNGRLSEGPPPIQWAVGSILEIGVMFESLGFKAGEAVTIAIAFYKKGIEVRRYSHIHLIVPDETYEQRMWSV